MTQAQPPKRTAHHERLQAFVGYWHAEGTSYGPASGGHSEPWVSEEKVDWLPGEFFVVQLWDATPETDPFSGIGVIGYDEVKGHYVTRSFENHGFYREYTTEVAGNVWTFLGETERARIEFTNGGDTQLIKWEWRLDGADWQPLCDRVAKRKIAAKATNKR